MTKRGITMSQKETDRVGVTQSTVAKRITQRQAAEQLGLSVRQIKRRVRRYRADKALGLVSRRSGRPSPRALAPVLQRVAAHYPDFGPTLAHEKLTAEYGHAFSTETLRQWMMAGGLWQPKPRRPLRLRLSAAQVRSHRRTGNATTPRRLSFAQTLAPAQP